MMDQNHVMLIIKSDGGSVGGLSIEASGILPRRKSKQPELFFNSRIKSRITVSLFFILKIQKYKSFIIVLYLAASALA